MTRLITYLTRRAQTPTPARLHEAMFGPQAVALDTYAQAEARVRGALATVGVPDVRGEGQTG